MYVVISSWFGRWGVASLPGSCVSLRPGACAGELHLMGVSCVYSFLLVLMLVRGFYVVNGFRRLLWFMRGIRSVGFGACVFMGTYYWVQIVGTDGVFDNFVLGEVFGL